ncbi:MAG: tRNA (adenosine(37)-N6)-threonylcarbamoyltransferase complex transferase subunit TsaD [bacterium]|nr:tRNA (adenosine(37)-N6)-threonylcarbamoyltransferase complex transferase subunit TsaD [bacterium]
MIILGIDTSCDDTCVSALEFKNGKLKIESNVVSSQVKLHAKYGGVYPMLAKREHIKNLPSVYKEAVRGMRETKIDFIGVTTGPGLEPCLWQGVNFARDLAKKLKKPLIHVNHIEAHILANLLGRSLASIKFPAICLVVSGGHTQLILMKGVGKYKLIGETRDDAAGECFDKAARILGLSYPGGPVIALEAAKYNMRDAGYEIRLPRPMMYTKDYDFSFSGLKTAVLYEFQKRSAKTRKSKGYVREMCKEIQQSIIDVLIWKTLKAAKDFKVKSAILGGGVTANQELRKQFEERIGKEIPSVKCLAPDAKYSTDNAAMIALTAYFHKNKKTDLRRIKVDANLGV